MSLKFVNSLSPNYALKYILKKEIKITLSTWRSFSLIKLYSSKGKKCKRKGTSLSKLCIRFFFKVQLNLLNEVFYQNTFILSYLILHRSFLMHGKFQILYSI